MNFSLVNRHESVLEVELVSVDNRTDRLRTALAGEHGYDIVFIDCPPSLGPLTRAALSLSTEVIMPIQCEYFAMEGVSNLLKTVDDVRRFLNPELAIDGILLTMYDDRTNLAQQVAQEVHQLRDRLG